MLSNKNLPLVSVVVPTFNRKNTLIRAIDSIVSQSYRPIEIVVVDDGSFDGTKNVIDDLILSVSNDNLLDLRYFFQRNQGAPIARNKGAIESRGDYLVFHDSDDLMHEHRLKHQIEKILSMNAVLCCGSWKNFPDISGGFCAPNHSDDCLADFLMGKILGSNQSWMMKKDAFSRVGGFDPLLRCGQDIDLVFRLLCLREKVAFSPEALTYFCHSEKDRISSKGITEEGMVSLFDGHLKRVKILRDIGVKKYLKLEGDCLVCFAVDSLFLGFKEVSFNSLALAKVATKRPTWNISKFHSFVFLVAGLRSAALLKKLKEKITKHGIF